ncbi:DNA-binding transcriptional MocR family regulator [Phyllobacterium ifriqiyense]|uniref:DNA-binding transcriptional MocR family regulator n=1 Tax=Phyllobacterium ifriqiyense TaxID=314238 RepID=A0ABU0S648_9HYPH|nr:DNA-binding transcriptional MocR family regulator [Phyllobacterium ifriqiyense]
MRLKSPWSARLAESEGNPSHRLLEALSQDILSGHLKGGDRLPPHRELAWTLRLGVGTVTKAYAVLERRGLARSIKGKGTFVAELQSEMGQLIDLSVNAIPPMLSDRLLARTLSTVARKIDAQHVHLRPPLAGHNAHRRILGRWLESLGVIAEPNRIILTGSGQQALWLAFDTLCGGRGLIVTERLSYSGAIALARHRGHPIQGVEIDPEGMVPADLARVLDRQTGDPRRRLVYVTPTLHNPTTASMSSVRRQEIIEVCRKRDVPIVEDGALYAGCNARTPASGGVGARQCLPRDKSFQDDDIRPSVGCAGLASKMDQPRGRGFANSTAGRVATRLCAVGRVVLQRGRGCNARIASDRSRTQSKSCHLAPA